MPAASVSPIDPRLGQFSRWKAAVADVAESSGLFPIHAMRGVGATGCRRCWRWPCAREVVPRSVELRWRSSWSGGDHVVIMTHGTDSLRGDVRIERDAERGQVQVAVDASELLARLAHPRRRTSAAPWCAFCQFFTFIE